jgi:hypothetical protein
MWMGRHGSFPGAHVEGTACEPFFRIGDLGRESAKGKENAKKAKEYWKTAGNIWIAYKMLAHAGKQTTTEISQGLRETHTHFVISEADTIKLNNALTKAYNSAIAGVKKWSEKVKFYESKIRQERMSTADLIRSLNRKTMDEEDAWYDKKQEAEEKLSEAKKAFAKGDYETAKKLTEQAKDLYKDLATTVTKTTEDGATETVMSLQDTTDTAVEGIQKASSTMQEILTKQKNNAQGMVKDFQEKADAIKTTMNELIKPGKKKIDIERENYNKIKQQIDALGADITKTIHIKQVADTTPEKHRFGGLAGYASGGALSGYGGGDIIPALLEPGEFILRKESVKKYGVRLLSALNNLSAPINLVPRFQTGGIVTDFTFAGYKHPVDLLQSEAKAFDDVLKWMKRSGLSHWMPMNFQAQFENWWKKQQDAHSSELKQMTSQQKVSLDLNLNGKSYPVEGDSNVVQQLLDEIKKLKALGYA